MQITSRFTIAVHIITFLEFYAKKEKVTSSYLAKSVGANPVIIRGIMSKLKDAGILTISQGKSGIEIARPLNEISFFDVYQAIECVNGNGLFHLHENPNLVCPVGKNIHNAMMNKLEQVQQSMENEMKNITIADVVENIYSRMSE